VKRLVRPETRSRPERA